MDQIYILSQLELQISCHNFSDISLICWREDEDVIQVDKARVVQHVPENIVEGVLEKCGGTGETIGHYQIVTATKRSLPPVVCLFFSFGPPPGPEDGVWMMRTECSYVSMTFAHDMYNLKNTIWTD